MPGEKLICAPANAQRILIVNKAKGSSSSSSYLLPKDFGTGALKYTFCAFMTGGSVVCPPYNAEKVLVIDAEKNSSYFMSEQYGTGFGKYSGCVVTGKIMVCAPYRACTMPNKYCSSILTKKRLI